MKRLTLASLLVLTGCAPFLDAQSDLVTQARRGLEIAQSNSAGCTAAHEQLTRLKRQRLDEAFDADVRERDQQGDLSGDWVIAHRAAYAVALEAYARHQAERAASEDVARRNLKAIDAALERLQWLQSIQNRWMPQPQEKR